MLRCAKSLEAAGERNQQKKDFHPTHIPDAITRLPKSVETTAEKVHEKVVDQHSIDVRNLILLAHIYSDEK